MTREFIRSVADMAERTSTVSAFDRSRIRRVIRFAETVGEAMIPVAEMTAINEQTETAQAVKLVRRHGYNRLPLYRGNISNVVGIVTLTTWDLIDPGLANRPIDDFTHPAHYVSAHQTIDELLPVLRTRNDHMAVVVDEFGSTVGMITSPQGSLYLVDFQRLSWSPHNRSPRKSRPGAGGFQEIVAHNMRAGRTRKADEIAARESNTCEPHRPSGTGC